jgi:biopolymer transport protein ExbD
MHLRLAPLVALVAALSSCDDADKPQNPFDPPPGKAKQPPPTTEAPKPTGPPDLAIDTISVKVGYTRAMLDKPDGRQQLESQLAEHKQHLQGKTATLRVDRKAKIPWVVAYIDELAELGVDKVLVKTETREDYSAELPFTPQAKVSSPAPCSVVATIMEDRGTAVWKLSGGVASKRSKGFAGPDLTMTQDTLSRLGKACKQSSLIFVSAPVEIEWGLVYDLAASAQKLPKTPFDTFVVLRETPVPGHSVSLSD